MDLGARRLDLIGMKWELSQEIIENYALAVAGQHDKSQRPRRTVCWTRSAATTADCRICAMLIRRPR
jgi:hypothetical protein